MDFPTTQKDTSKDVFLTKNIKILSRMISKSITLDSPNIIFDTVRHQIRSFVCLFLSHAPKMEIHKMVTLDNVDWFISHSFGHVEKPEVNEIILFGVLFLTDEIMLKSKKYMCSYLI